MPVNPRGSTPGSGPTTGTVPGVTAPDKLPGQLCSEDVRTYKNQVSGSRLAEVRARIGQTHTQ